MQLGELPFIWSAGDFFELAKGMMVLPRLLLATELIQDIGNLRCPYARTDLGPGDELDGGILRIEYPSIIPVLHDGPGHVGIIVGKGRPLVYRLSVTQYYYAYLAEWPD